MPTLVRDTVTSLSLQGFVGNPLQVVLTLEGAYLVPAITARLFYAADGRALPEFQQPLVTIDGRVVTLRFPAPDETRTYWAQIFFGGRAVLAGPLAFSRATVPTPQPKPYTVAVKLTPTATPVNLSVVSAPGLYDALDAADRAEAAAEQAQEAAGLATGNDATDFLAIYELFKQV